MHKLLTKFGLRFEDPNEELSFVRSFTLDDLGRTQAAMVLGASVYCAFSIWDWFLGPEGWQIAMLLRLAVAIFILLPATLVLFKPQVRRFAEIIYLIYCVVPGCMLCVIYLFLRPDFDHGAAGMIIVILFVSTMLPLRISSLAVFCVITWACFVSFETLTPHLSAGMRFVNNFEIGIAYTLSLYGVGAREFSARRQFRTSQALRDEKERSEATLIELRTTQVHLVQAEKHAALGQLVAGVAHEINTPIGLALTTSTAFDSNLSQLRQTILSGQIRRSYLTQSIEHLETGAALIFSNLTRAIDLIRSFKKVATDQAAEDRRAFELHSWLLELMDTLGPLLRRRGHEVQIQCAEGIVLDTYPGALAQVVSNLALNAVTHAFHDGHSGTLSLNVIQIEVGMIRIVFRDDGAGISEVDLPRIFDPFFTTKRDQGSTGLGLHIVYNLVVSTLRGKIDIQSEKGVGTQFTIDIPQIL